MRQVEFAPQKLMTHEVLAGPSSDNSWFRAWLLVQWQVLLFISKAHAGIACKQHPVLSKINSFLTTNCDKLPVFLDLWRCEVQWLPRLVRSSISYTCPKNARLGSCEEKCAPLRRSMPKTPPIFCFHPLAVALNNYYPHTIATIFNPIQTCPFSYDTKYGLVPSHENARLPHQKNCCWKLPVMLNVFKYL